MVIGDCDDHAAGKIQCESYHPMEQISGFIQSRYMLPSGECLRPIVKTQTKHNM